MDPITILHVDDASSQLLMMKLIFKELDMSVKIESCDSPVKAIRLVAENGFDCVISDYVMPGLNGIELAERVHEFKDIPFILYTGQGSEEVAQRAFQAGVDDYIRKEIEPSHYEVLLNSVRHAVEKHRAEQIYRAVFDSNPDAIFVVHDNKITFSNAAAVELFGVGEESRLHGRRFVDFVVDVDPDELSWMSLQRIISEDSVIPFEFNLLGGDGVKKRVKGSLQNMLFKGTPSQIYFLKDVTVQRTVEDQLLQLTHKFKRLFELSPVSVAFVSMMDNVRSSNRAFRDLFGIDEACSGFKLLHEPGLYRRIRGRVMSDDSINFESQLDFDDLNEQGYLKSSKSGVQRVAIIVSPLLDPSADDLFLLQVQQIT